MSLLLSLSPAAEAANFTVHDGEIVGQQSLTDPGDVGTIEQGGTVSESGFVSHAVDALGDDNTVNNEGTINSSGTSSTGIYSVGGNAIIDNGGLIDGSGDFAAGIYSAEHDASIINRGTIITSGFQTGGISSAGDDATIDNRGTITTTSENGIGILSGGNDVAIFNSGRIEVTGASAQAVLAYGDNPVFTNSGTIIASDPSAYAVVMYGNATLNLLAGTAIQNDFYFGNPSNTQLNIGTGLNTALYFYGSNLPGNIDTSGQPYVISNKVLAVADPTGLVAANGFAFDLTRSIADAIAANAGTGSSNGGGGSDAATSAATGDGRGIWAAGLGFYGDHKASGSLDGYHYGAGGFMGGVDRSLAATATAGVFGGVSGGRMATAADSTRINAFSGFAGAYWNNDDGARFTRLSFTGGGGSNQSDRTVANNKVVGGLETAEATYGAYFFSPAVTFGVHHNAGSAVVSPSFGVRYTGLYRAGYTETGSLADMVVASGTAQSIDVRGEVKTDFAAKVSAAGVEQFNIRVGMDGIFNWGSTVSAELLGTGIDLLASGQQSVARGYIGAGSTFTQANGTVFNLGVEGSYDSTAAVTATASASVRRSF